MHVHRHCTPFVLIYLEKEFFIPGLILTNQSYLQQWDKDNIVVVVDRVPIDNDRNIVVVEVE